MGLFNNYQKAGKGVSKDEINRKGFISFFQLFIRKFWNLVKLNLLYFAFCIPIVTIGPATAGLVKVLKNYTIEKNSFIFTDFFEAFKSNWKSSGIIGIIDIALIFFMFVASNVYPEMSAQSGNKAYFVPLVISLALGIIILMMHFYIYQMIVATQLKFKDVLKNSLILVSAGMKNNIIALFGVLLVIALNIVLFFIAPYFILLIPLITFSLIWFIICYCTYPVIEKYVINPYYEQQGLTNPDYDYLNAYGDDEQEYKSVFEDNGGNDVPINYKTNKKSKFIS